MDVMWVRGEDWEEGLTPVIPLLIEMYILALLEYHARLKEGSQWEKMVDALTH